MGDSLAFLHMHKTTILKKEEFLVIVDKYLGGTATDQEEQLLINYHNSFQQVADWDEAELGKMYVMEEKLLQRLREAISKNKQAPVAKIIFWRKYIRVAVAAVLFIGCGIIYLWSSHSSEKKLALSSKAASNKQINDLPPGGNKAILTLGNGTAIILDSVQNGSLGHQGNASVLKPASGQLVYKDANAGTNEIVYNTVSTPKGGQYQIILPDGTKVWLNAASSLHFPTAFTGRERKVEITGEVYFEVAKNKDLPFRIKAHDAEITVMGTHFNVNAYDDEAAIKTTLLEGSVKISNRNNSNMLQPGQQAIVDNSNGNMYMLDDADVEEAVAWKNGRFQFNKADIPSVMRQIARWYNVEISYEGNIPTDHFTGKIPRNANASSVLKILSMSDEHFRIEDKKIIVTSK